MSGLALKCLRKVPCISLKTITSLLAQVGLPGSVHHLHLRIRRSLKGIYRTNKFAWRLNQATGRSADALAGEEERDAKACTGTKLQFGISTRRLPALMQPKEGLRYNVTFSLGGSFHGRKCDFTRIHGNNLEALPGLE